MGMGMMDLPKAPADITPAKFFNEWLPTQMEPFKDMIASLGGDVSAAMSVRIKGEGGGDWTALLQGGEVKISEGISDDALVTIIMEAGNFVEAVTGQMEDFMQPPPGAGDMSPEQAAAKAKENLETLKGIHGTIKMALEDAEKPFWAMIKFQGEIKDEADVTVSMERATSLAIASGETNPQAAFMSGQVRIEGDMSILMQLMPLMM